MTLDPDHVQQLRDYAHCGGSGYAAATALLIEGFNGRFAEIGNPWISTLDNGAACFLPEGLSDDNMAGLSSGQRRYLHIVRDLAEGPMSELEMLDESLFSLVVDVVTRTVGQASL